MYDWIIEADLYRLRKARSETDNKQERHRIDEMIAAKVRNEPSRPARMIVQEREQKTWSYKST